MSKQPHMAIGLMPFVTNPPKTPELDKEAAVRDDAQVIGNFLEWLMTSHHVREGDKRIIDLDPRKLLYEYFKVDLDTCETERRQLLAYMRLINARTDIFKELNLSDPTTTD